MTTLVMAFLLMLAAILSAIVPAETVLEEPTARVVTGIASHYGSSCLSGCLALPEHKSWLPGIRVVVCGPAACITRTSNDAGPDLAMQRAGRVVDLARNDFEFVCGCHHSVGLVKVTVRYGGSGPRPTPPSTDVGP